MKEISYQVFDNESKLPFHSLTDSFIRTTAERKNRSCSEIFDEIKEVINNSDIEYFVSYNKKEIIPISTSARFKCPGQYFKIYSDAKIHLSEIQ